LKRTTATKDDFNQMKVAMASECRTFCKTFVADAVNPLKTEIEKVNAANEQIKGQIDALTRRTSMLEARPAQHVTDPGSGSAKAFRSMLQSLDPAHKRAVFIGFPEGLAAEQRVKEIESIMARFPAHKPVDVGNFWRGPRNNRSLTKVGFAEFGSADAARAFLNASSESAVLTQGGASIKIKAALTKTNAQRNWALRAALDLIKQSAPARGSTVEGFFDNRRCVKVDGEVAFEQDREQLDGTFRGRFSDLRLP